MAGTFKFIIFLIVLFCVVLENAQSQPDIQAIPAQILSGLTSSLEVNCNFSLDGASDMVALISLIVARAKDSRHDFEELASITTHSNNEIIKLTPENISVTGSFTALGKSHLHLRWNYPSDLQAGFYKCLGQGLDPIGRVIAMADTDEVTVKQPSFDDYIDKFQEVDMDMRSVKERVSYLEEQVFRILDFENVLTYNNHKYFVSSHPYFTMTNAVANCTLLGGYVVEIDDSSEYTAIKNFLNNAVGYIYVVIAGSDEDTEGTWILPSTKQPLPVLDWYSGQPEGGRRENCLVLCKPSSLWQMCDLPCVYGPDPSVRYMCEVP